MNLQIGAFQPSGTPVFPGTALEVPSLQSAACGRKDEARHGAHRSRSRLTRAREARRPEAEGGMAPGAPRRVRARAADGASRSLEADVRTPRPPLRRAAPRGDRRLAPDAEELPERRSGLRRRLRQPVHRHARSPRARNAFPPAGPLRDPSGPDLRPAPLGRGRSVPGDHEGGRARPGHRPGALGRGPPAPALAVGGPPSAARTASSWPRFSSRRFAAPPRATR